MKRFTLCRYILVCVLMILWCVIAHTHQAYASNVQGQNQIVLSKSEPELELVRQITESAQTETVNNSWQTELSNSVRQPSPYKPTIVFVYVRLNTVSQINLPEKTYDISAEIVLEWQDGRLAFTPDSKKTNALLLHQCNEPGPVPAPSDAQLG